jgi:hypothetical protein
MYKLLMIGFLCGTVPLLYVLVMLLVPKLKDFKEHLLSVIPVIIMSHLFMIFLFMGVDGSGIITAYILELFYLIILHMAIVMMKLGRLKNTLKLRMFFILTMPFFYMGAGELLNLFF